MGVLEEHCGIPAEGLGQKYKVRNSCPPPDHKPSIGCPKTRVKVADIFE